MLHTTTASVVRCKTWWLTNYSYWVSLLKWHKHFQLVSYLLFFLKWHTFAHTSLDRLKYSQWDKIFLKEYSTTCSITIKFNNKVKLGGINISWKHSYIKIGMLIQKLLNPLWEHAQIEVHWGFHTRKWYLVWWLCLQKHVTLAIYLTLPYNIGTYF